MRINWQLATAAVVGLLVIVLGAAWVTRPSGGVGGPAATPSPTPTAQPTSGAASPQVTPVPIIAADLTAAYTSPLHGYAVRYPSAWAATPATLTWVCGIRNNWGSGINDELSLAGVVRFSGASQKLAEGQTADEWISVSTGNPDSSTIPTIDVGGHQGFIDADGVTAFAGTIAPGAVMYDVVVVVDGRGYNFNMDGIVNRSSLEAMLATVTFDPASAVDAAQVSCP